MEGREKMEEVSGRRKEEGGWRMEGGRKGRRKGETGISERKK